MEMLRHYDDDVGDDKILKRKNWNIIGFLIGLHFEEFAKFM